MIMNSDNIDNINNMDGDTQNINYDDINKILLV